jgi:cytochrome P450
MSQVRDYANEFSNVDPAFADDFHDIMGDLRRRCPVARSNDYAGYWVLTKFDDVRDACRDWQTFSSADGVRPHMAGKDVPLMYPEESDPPLHQEWRQILNPYFSPKLVDGWRAAIATISDELIDGFVGAGEVDLVSAFAQQVPLRTIFEVVLGLPDELARQCHQLADLAVFDGDIEVSTRALRELHGVAHGVVTSPDDDAGWGGAVNAIRNAVIGGAPASDYDRSSVLMMLILAGLETTTNLLSGALWRLAEDRELFDRVSADPDLIPAMVDECLRHEGIVALMGRRLARDVEMRGTTMRAGDWAMVSFASANRDSEVFENADEFDIDRGVNKHIGFGVGIHRCLGSHLARSESIVALDRIIARCAGLKLQDGAERAYRVRIARGLVRVPVVVDPA